MAHITFATLKVICIAVKSFVTRILHWAVADRAASRMACDGDSCTIARRINGKFKDILPSPRGKATFRPELNRITARNTVNRGHEPLED